MPFKLRLKKSRQYNVVSKNLFVISVELLDNTIVECTLSADSTGLDCLYNVCQRLGLHQPEFFGLRYVSKQEKTQWIDLQKPLKKQLDKHAQEPNLYLGVMFYVADVQQLQDEMTRYQYFLQLKTDIIEGRLLCSQEQAVQLASYSLQAEFGDHDPERHTVEYLKGFVLLPKHMTNNEAQLEALTEEVVHTHHTLHSLSPAAAEIYYIILVQRLEGYGQELFTAKDESSNELYIGVSLIGIVIKLITGQQIDCFKWNDITNLTFHKRIFGIECEKSNKSMQLHMEDAESAKYIWKISVQQHQFYMKNKIETIPANVDSPVEAAQTSFLDIPHSSSQQSIHDSKNNLEALVTQHDAPNSVESINIIHHPEIHFEDHSNNFTSNGPYTAVVHGDSMFSVNSLGQPNVNFSQNIQSSSSLSLLSSQSSSQQLRALLPSYRPAPDYETAIQHKYGNPGSFIGNLGSSHVYSQQDGLAFSQPEIRQQQHAAQVKSYSHYKNFIDLANLDAVSYGSSYTNCALGNDILPHRAIDRMSVMPNLMLPPTHTYSTPELTTQGIVPPESHLSSDLSALHYQYKPPPPYPYNQRSSASTPDLACQTLQNNRHSSSSPDLVSRKNLGINQGIINEDSTTDKENVAYINQQIIHGNIFALQNTVHSVSPQVKITRVNSLAGDGNYIGAHKHSVGFVAVPPSPVKAEFVTTNISISHASSNFPGNRSRTSSTQSAPEIITTTTTHETNSQNPSMIPNPVSSEQYKNGIGNQVATTSKGSSSGVSNCAAVPDENKHQHFEKKKDALKENHNLGPMMLAAMNGLTLSRPDLIARQNSDTSVPKDTRCQFLESRMKEGLVFVEFEQVPKKRINADYSTALLPDNAARNRFKDVLPYEDNRVRLAPSKENKTGYINASHISVTVSQQQRFYIAAQGPLANTATSFWQMIWEQHAMLIVMLTEIQEHGRDKCFPYWPQENIKQEFGEYLVACKFSNKSESYITSALVLNHIPSKKQRSVWHIQYTGWPDHGCPEDLPGFLRFMEEIDSVRRHAAIEIPKGRSRNTPIVVHCSAGVGRSGVTILTDIMLYCLDHNENIDVPKMLALLRQQRMLIVQTVAQYKFIYSVLIQYLKNSRLI